MDELVKALRHFITRDLLYLVGGGSVVAAFLYLFDRLPGPNDHQVVFLLLAGVSYFVGYGLQEFACLTGAVTTAMPHRLSAFHRWLYQRLQREQWRDIPDNVDLINREWTIPEARKTQLERIVTLNQVGATGFACYFVSAALFFVRGIQQSQLFDLAVAAAAFALSLVLCALAWVKAGQQAQYVQRFGNP